MGALGSQIKTFDRGGGDELPPAKDSKIPAQAELERGTRKGARKGVTQFRLRVSRRMMIKVRPANGSSCSIFPVTVTLELWDGRSCVSLSTQRRPVPSSSSNAPASATPKEFATRPATVISWSWNRPGSRLMDSTLMRCEQADSIKIPDSSEAARVLFEWQQ